jgi:porin
VLRPSKAFGTVRFWVILIALISTVSECNAQAPSPDGASAEPAIAQATDNLQPGGAAGELSAVSPAPGQSPIRRLFRRVFGVAPARDDPGAVSRSGGGSGPGPIVGGPDDARVYANGVGGDIDTAVAGLADAAGAVEAGNGASAGSQPISSNPGAVDIIAGTGALGRLLGFDANSGIRVGGLWIGDASGVLSGGAKPGSWGLNSLTIADLNFDTDKLFGWKGGSIGTEYLQFTGMPTNSLAGAFPGFDSLEAGPPLTRNQLYELWYRQTLFDDKLIVRIGKSVPTYDFNNVVRPVPVGDDPAAAIPAVSSLVYTPIFVNPTMLGVIPGYYNSATGVTITVAPTKSFYLNYGFYDGNLANHRQTGLEGPHFNGYYFHIGEAGYAYRLGEQRKPGNFGVGVWGQTGKLTTFGNGIENGANGVYLFGAQRLWFRRPGLDSSGVSGFYQFGANNSDALLARDYVGGGFTAFGLVPGRPDDSFGCGLAWTALNRGDAAGRFFDPHAPLPDQLRPSQLMLQWYYQMKIVNGWFFQTALTEIPTPAQATAPNALALTLRVIVLF